MSAILSIQIYSTRFGPPQIKIIAFPICVSDSLDLPIMCLQAAMTITNASNTTMAAQPYQNSAAILPSHPPSVPPSVPTTQMAAAPKSASISLMPLLDGPEIRNNNNQATNLVKPSSFFSPPPSSSALVMPSVPSSMPAAAAPLNPSGSLQRPYGAPLLQPFPPPTPPPSLTPTSVPIPHYGPVISRDKVRDALLVLVQVCLF